MGLRMALGDLALTLTNQGAGTVVSGSIAAGGSAADVILMLHVRAVGAGTPTITASLEESATGEGSWTAVPGSATAAVAGLGNAMSNGRPTKSYVRVTATIGGGTPDITGRASVLMFAE